MANIGNNLRNRWLGISLVNLFLVALLGLTLRSKILFEIRFLDYKNLLSAHSHFAFAGWAGLALITLMIFDFLPATVSAARNYRLILAGILVSAFGMGMFFPFFGYNWITISFATLYMAVLSWFTIVFIRDVNRTGLPPTVRLLGIASVISLLFSFLGIAGLSWVMATLSGGADLYRHSMYTFLHFQYNGFFTLAVFAVLFRFLYSAGIGGKDLDRFALYLCLSVIPSLFLSLLWKGRTWYYVLGAIGCLLMIISLYFFYRWSRRIDFARIFTSGIARVFCYCALVSFALKTVMQIGTVVPSLGDAVYGDRPVIIGFLHLVFLGFVSFFILAVMIEKGLFTYPRGIQVTPLVIFAIGIFLNEILLMLQGLGILLGTNNDIYKWLLWITAIVLSVGAGLLVVSRLGAGRTQKNKAMEDPRPY